MKYRYSFFGLLFTLCIHSFLANAQQHKNYITVAKDGTGDFTSIQKAIESCKLLIADLRGIGETSDESDKNDKKYDNAAYRNSMLSYSLGNHCRVNG